MEGGLDDAVLTLATGEERAGADLRALVEEARQVRHILDGLHTRYHRGVVQQAAIAGALNPDLLSNDERGKQAADYIARRLDILAEETERGWSGTFGEATGLVFERTVRGVAEVQTIDAALIHSSDARRLDAHAGILQAVYLRPATLKRKDVKSPIFGPQRSPGDGVRYGAQGRHHAALQGAGRDESRAAFWETTLDPNVRSLLQVTLFWQTRPMTSSLS